ncbi:hypothetical protein RJ640_009424 [Escallonia rubra]|uniref:Subtilisin-like protease fibronectin type-III domain-containing protein n=1 Tax=Escallonia rubra TaxID=112253 RepID=A0AA88U4Q5_9ASTE|nr:hypothetical protein RJ640_009424 [Escallonia rubra]
MENTKRELQPAAYVKSFHLTWSPAAIKSAIMTRALDKKHSTSSQETNGTVWDLSMPSFAVSTTVSKPIMRVFHRTVTNVGFPVSAYRAVVTTPPELNIQVEPSVVSFSSLGQKASFTVTLTGMINKKVVSALLVWDDGLHVVRSPIASYLLESK